MADEINSVFKGLSNTVCDDYLTMASTIPVIHSGNSIIIFDIRKSVLHHTFQIIQPTRCNNFTSLLLDVYVWLNMFLAPLHPSSGAYNCTRSLWFFCWSIMVGALLVVVSQRPWPTTLQPPHSNGRTRGS